MTNKKTQKHTQEETTGKAETTGPSSPVRTGHMCVNITEYNYCGGSVAYW